MEENKCVGYWSLLLSQLPFIYSHMTKEHLETVAKEMVKAVQLGARENDCVGQKLSVVEAISVFLESEGFVEMRVLQELIVNEFCANLSSCLKRRYIHHRIFLCFSGSLTFWAVIYSCIHIALPPITMVHAYHEYHGLYDLSC